MSFVATLIELEAVIIHEISQKTILHILHFWKLSQACRRQDGIVVIKERDV